MKYNIDLILAKTIDIKDGDFKEKLELIADDVKRKKWLDEKYSSLNRDMITSGIDALYRENAILSEQNKELNRENEMLKARLEIEIERNRKLKSEFEHSDDDKNIGYDIEI